MRILAKSTGNSEEVLEKEINRPRYFSPQTAIDFGIIDRVSCSSHLFSLRYLRIIHVPWSLFLILFECLIGCRSWSLTVKSKSGRISL